jgi:hypothetical protein
VEHENGVGHAMDFGKAERNRSDVTKILLETTVVVQLLTTFAVFKGT